MRWRGFFIYIKLITISTLGNERNYNMKKRQELQDKRWNHGYISCKTGNEKSPPEDFSSGGLHSLDEKRRLPTLPHCIAVPSAQAGLTSLFGMGRGGTPPLSPPDMGDMRLRYRQISWKKNISSLKHNRRIDSRNTTESVCLGRKALGQLVALGFDVAVFTPAPYQRRRLRRPSVEF